MIFQIMDRLGWTGIIPRFRRDRRGNVAIMFALMAVVLLLSIGAAIDFGRWLHARDQTASAIDAALLAGGRMLQINRSNVSGAVAAAQSYYTQNVTARLPVINDSVTFSVTDNGMAITASGTAYIKTPFLQLANIDKLPLLNTAGAIMPKAQIAVGGNGGQNLEVAMMLDITGSMAGQKLADLKAAATDLVNIVVSKDQSKFTSKISLVPFSEDIRLPTTSAMNLARGTGWPNTKSITTWLLLMPVVQTYYLSDCVVERTGTQSYSDAAPKSGQYVTAHYTANSTGLLVKKGVCTVPAGSEVLPLTSDSSVLATKINGLSANGGTAGHLGTAWAWYTLSPNWNSLWSSSNQAASYSSGTKKIAILMTDGEFNTQYSASGTVVDQNLYPTCANAANGCSTTQARQLCSNMKSAGITIYTVGFALGGNQNAIDTLNQCATDSTKFYNASTGDQLKQAFRDIGLKLSSLYLSQ
jgi:Flp pilus assembly protein TadG